MTQEKKEVFLVAFGNAKRGVKQEKGDVKRKGELVKGDVQRKRENVEEENVEELVNNIMF